MFQLKKKRTCSFQDFGSFEAPARSAFQPKSLSFSGACNSDFWMQRLVEKSLDQA